MFSSNMYILISRVQTSVMSKHLNTVIQRLRNESATKYLFFFVRISPFDSFYVAHFLWWDMCFVYLTLKGRYAKQYQREHVRYARKKSEIYSCILKSELLDNSVCISTHTVYWCIHLGNVWIVLFTCSQGSCGVNVCRDTGG